MQRNLHYFVITANDLDTQLKSVTKFMDIRYNKTSNRRAYHTWAEHNNQDTQPDSQIPSLPGLSVEQSKQLYQFLSNLTGSNQNNYNDQETRVTNMSGIISSLMSTAHNTNVICYTCKLGNSCWILDSRASDHMSYDVSALHDLNLLEYPIYVSIMKWS